MKLLLKFFCLGLTLASFWPLKAQSLEWQQQHPIPTGVKINQIIEPAPGKIWLICDGGVILQTLNGGLTFSPISNAAGGYNLRGAAVLGRDSVAICGEALQIWVTTNGGSTWNTENNNQNNADVLVSIAYNRLKSGVAAGFTGIALSKSATATGWTQTQVNTPWTMQGLFFSDDQTVYAGGSNRTIFRSTNAGQSWAQIYQAPAPTLNEVRGFTAAGDTLLAYGQAGYLMALAGSNITANTILNTGLGSAAIIGTFKIDESWVCIASNGAIASIAADSLTSGTFNAIKSSNGFNANAALSASNGQIFIAGNNGFLAVLDSGIHNSWKIRSTVITNQDLRNVVFRNSQLGFACGNGETILKTTNGGQTWRVARTGGQQLMRGLDLPNDSTVLAVGYSGKVWLSTDTGNSFRQVNINTPNNLTFAHCKTGTWWIGGFGGTLFRSTNQGNSWEYVAVPVAQTLTDLAQFNDTLIISGTRGTIIRSTDGGNSWNQMVTGIRNHLMSIAFVDAQNAYAAGWDATIMKSTDGGISWANQILPQNQGDYWSVRFTSPTLGWVMGNLGVTNRTQDGGQTWQPVYTANTQDIFGAFFLDQNNGWAVGKAGTILKFTASPLGINSQIKEATPEFWIDASGIICSNFKVEQGASYAITDILGRTLKSGQWQKGPVFQQALNATSNLYFISLELPAGKNIKAKLGRSF